MTTVDLIKNLTQTTYDSVEGYRLAAEKSDNPTLERAFARRAGDRAEILNRLNSAIQSRGEAPVTAASTQGKAHQFFLTLTEALGDSNEAAIKRVEEGEEYLAEQFRDALKREDLDKDTRMLIETAYRDVREGERFSDMLEQHYA
ncbi:PA2169 family four-helix-bundle protein [Erythrobacter sp. JK5]|uniref:PA2169 family four-helix-bundle protein n=1 Tax=Erythrobacter sp. JK5 TaxID=2829500 RepID=UPI001BA454A6|nr:PA2169 family four-helix-bundle protein [Erythrobacter sp. JK5]QUL39089.1 PA2169 family four-helix-bundle protein [Erythrobacter sp. JK5]